MLWDSGVDFLGSEIAGELASFSSVCEWSGLTAGTALTGDREGRRGFKYASCDVMTDGPASSSLSLNAASSKYRSKSELVGANCVTIIWEEYSEDSLLGGQSLGIWKLRSGLVSENDRVSV